MPGILIVSMATQCACRCVFCGLPDTEQHSVIAPTTLALAVEGHTPNQPWTEVNLTGGDPLILPSARALFQILATKRPHFCRVSVCTAGIPAGKALDGLEALLRLIPDVIVYISLDGVGPVHDRVRGRAGAFNECDRFVTEARRQTARVFLHCVINSWNVQHLDDVADYADARSLQVAYAFINISDHYINNAHLNLPQHLTGDEIDTASDFLSRRSPGYLYDDLIGAMRGLPRPVPCRLLTEGVLLTSDGVMAICGSDTRMILGTLTQQPHATRESWDQLVANRPRIIGDHAADVCKRCVYLY